MKERFGVITTAEAKEKGLKTAPVKTKTCPHCGKELEQFGILGGDGAVHWLSTLPCGCAGENAETERLEEERRREEQERKEREFRARCSRAGIARKYLDAQVGEQASIDYINGFADANGRGLYLVGGVGAGKTHEACAIARAFIGSGYTVVVTTSLAMLDQVYSNQHGQPTRSATDYCRANLLVIDDLGKENANQWAVTTLFQIINSRYEDMLPTIITSQYSLQALQKRMSRSGEAESAQAIASRINEMCDVVKLAHPDRRKRGANK